MLVTCVCVCVSEFKHVDILLQNVMYSDFWFTGLFLIGAESVNLI